MKKVVFFLALFAVPVLILAIGIVPNPNDQNTAETTGIVTQIFEGGEKDIVFKLSGRDEVLYINRGLEQGLSIEDLGTQLIGREVLFVHPSRSYGNRHLYHVQYKDQKIFSQDPDFIPLSLRK